MSTKIHSEILPGRRWYRDWYTICAHEIGGNYEPRCHFVRHDDKFSGEVHFKAENI